MNVFVKPSAEPNLFRLCRGEKTTVENKRTFSLSRAQSRTCSGYAEAGKRLLKTNEPLKSHNHGKESSCSGRRSGQRSGTVPLSGSIFRERDSVPHVRGGRDAAGDDQLGRRPPPRRHGGPPRRPVIGAPSHAAGINRLVAPMAMSATACNADGLIIEVHNDPIHALCDGAQSLRPEQFDVLMGKIREIRKVVTA